MRIEQQKNISAYEIFYLKRYKYLAPGKLIFAFLYIMEQKVFSSLKQTKLKIWNYIRMINNTILTNSLEQKNSIVEALKFVYRTVTAK